MDKPLPKNWVSDCKSCTWFLETYEREDLFLFTNLDGEEHILNYYEAKVKEDKVKIVLGL